MRDLNDWANRWLPPGRTRTAPLRFTEIVGENVRRRRSEMGISQQALGERVADCLRLPRPWPKQTVSSIERGKRVPDVEELLAIASVLEVLVITLLRPANWRGEILGSDDGIQLGQGREYKAEVIAQTIAPKYAELEGGEDLMLATTEAVFRWLEKSQVGRRRGRGQDPPGGDPKPDTANPPVDS